MRKRYQQGSVTKSTDERASRLAHFLCARPLSRRMIGQKAEAMNEEMDREWGPEAVRLWNEWIDLSEAERDIQKSRPEYVENYLAWKEEVERVCKVKRSGWHVKPL